MAIPVRQRAIFWLALTLLVWFGFFIAFRREQSEVRWFFFVLFCRAGLRRVSARSLDHQHHALHPARMGPFGGRVSADRLSDASLARAPPDCRRPLT
jgi:hypothetical protein